MVCLGNICRSPLAEGILKSKLPDNHFQIDSAGTAIYQIGKPPDYRSVAIAAKYGIDITAQKARQFKASDFNTFDYIYAMDHQNFKNILKLARNTEDITKVKLILNALGDLSEVDVPDPYYGGDQGFENVFQMLDKACVNIAKMLVS
jgi:protein-tyrosine phosphatase